MEDCEPSPLNCPLCSNPRVRQFFRKSGHTYYRCPSCAHLFVFPLPSRQAVHKYCEESYSSQYLVKMRAWFEVLARRRVEILASLFSAASGRRLLDVGCGYGFFLKEAQSRGWDALGIEASLLPLLFAREELGVHVIEHELEDVFTALKLDFDAITFWHVLEHLEQPASAMNEAIEHLRPGGCLIVNSPNIDSAVFKIVGKRWSWIYAPGHNHYFSLSGLAGWLERRGLELVVRTTWTAAPNLYFLLQEALLLGIVDALAAVRLPPLPRLTRRLRAFVSSDYYQTALQLRLQRVYQRSPWIDGFLRRRDLGHEFVIIARKR